MIEIPHKSRKGQQSVEYLATIAISLGVLLVAAGTYVYYEKSLSKDISNSQVNKIGNELVNTIGYISSAGGYSVKKVTFTPPEGMTGVYVEGVYSDIIVFNVTSTSGTNQMMFSAGQKILDLTNKSISGGVLYVVKNYGYLMLANDNSYNCSRKECCISSGCCRNGTAVCRLQNGSDYCLGEVLGC
jgi:hypothetical protein